MAPVGGENTVDKGKKEDTCLHPVCIYLCACVRVSVCLSVCVCVCVCTLSFSLSLSISVLFRCSDSSTHGVCACSHWDFVVEGALKKDISFCFYYFGLPSFSTGGTSV